MSLKKALQLPRHYKRIKGLEAAIACVLLCSVMTTFTLAQTFTVGLAVSYDGVSLGVVEDMSVIEDANQLLADQMITHTDEALITYESQKVVNRQTLLNAEELAQALVASTDSLVEATAIYVDGDVYAVVDEESSAKSLLDAVVQENSTMNSTDATIANDVELVATICDPTEISDASVVQLDAVSSLSVETTSIETTTRVVAYETIVTESDDYPVGATILVSEGTAGVSTFEESVTYIDGEETARTIITETVLTAAIAEETIVGTGEFTLSEEFIFLTMPLENCYINSVYGERWGSFHAGLDLCIPGGTAGQDVSATFDGVVITAEYHESYGNYVIIDHGNGYTSLYAHMDSIVASVGDVLTAGDLVGYAGNTGNSTGAHLHFELRYNNDTVNPALYLPDFVD